MEPNEKPDWKKTPDELRVTKWRPIIWHNRGLPVSKKEMDHIRKMESLKEGVNENDDEKV